MKKLLFVVFCALVLLTFCLTLVSKQADLVLADDPTPTPTPYLFYLPLVNLEWRSRAMAYTHAALDITTSAHQSAYVDGQWQRYSISWIETEPTINTLVFSSTIDNNMDWFYENGIPVQLVFRQAPLWAARLSGYVCSGPASNYVEHWADTLHVLVDRYPAVKAVGIMNEPQCGPTYGQEWCDCYAGEEDLYIDLLEAAQAEFEEEDILIVAGECSGIDEWCETVAVDGAEFYDALAYHDYDIWNTTTYTDGIENVMENFLSIRETVPVSREVWLTENNMRDTTYTCGSQFQEDRANYIHGVWHELRYRIDMYSIFALMHEDWECVDISNPPTFFDAWYIFEDIVSQSNKRR